jgi:hydrogenase-4 component B
MLIPFSSLFCLLLIAPLVAGATRAGKSPIKWIGFSAALVTIAALICGAGAALVAWCRGIPVGLDLSHFSPFSFQLSLDRLSGFFLFIVCAVSIPAVSFSLPYVAQHYEKSRAVWYWSLLPLFLLSMTVVVTAATVFAFFLGWELMTVLSAALIYLEGDSEERRRNIFLYLITMHAGAALVISAFLLFAPRAPSLDFASIRTAAGAMAVPEKTAIFLLAFFGFGTKAGIIPLHVWLPRAHPIAPTPVSALMSGIMLKTAVYAFLRFVFDFLSGGPAWGGYLLLVAGGISAVLGILYALFENDLKRLLAYSSIENVGIIYLAMGAAMICMKNQAPVYAALALLAALIHSLNHAIFKNLLFLGAGAIHSRTHSLKLNDLGGLLKLMPMSGTFFLIGCVSIAGLPLFNGFIGEWIVFQSFLAGGKLSGPIAQVVIPLAAGALALTSAVAAACFVNVFGAAFLGRPRSPEIRPSSEVSLSMLLPQGLLATACLVVGLMPMLLIRPLWSVVETLIPGSNFDSVARIGSSIQAMAVVVLLAATATLAVRFLTRVVVRSSPTWGCGLAALTARMQYTATSFSKPLRTVFATVYRAERKLEVSPAEKLYFPEAISYQSTRTVSYEKLLYRPVVNSILAAAQQLRRLQTGNIQWYLLYIFLALIFMLLFMRFR